MDADDGGGAPEELPAELLPKLSTAAVLRSPDASRRPWDSSPSLVSAWYLRLCAFGTVVRKAPPRFQSRVQLKRRQQRMHTWVWPETT